MTVFEVLEAVAAKSDKFKFKHRGKGETCFITSLNGKSNEGVQGRNWIFHVNGEAWRP